APYSLPALRKLRLRPSPRRLVDLLLRTGPKGDLFGLRPSGLSFKKLRDKYPHGLVLEDYVRTGVLRGRLRHRDRRLALAPPAISGELERLASVNADDPAFPLRLIGMRELRSHNSWMHNAPLLMRGGRTHALRMHPDDAAEAGVAEDDFVRISSPDGTVEAPVTLTGEMTRGAVALPHGWGHRGGWRLANKAGGVNVNLLAASAADGLERLAGMAHLNGIPVRVEPAEAREREPAE